MSDFPIPHLPPILFVRSLLFSDYKEASVVIEFEEIPTLGMIIEAAAQASSAILDEEKQKVQAGFLIALKDVQLIDQLRLKRYVLNISLEHKIEHFRSFSFVVIDGEEKIVTGFFSLSLKN